MVVHRYWKKTVKARGFMPENFIQCEGWFLFGFIPLYLRQL